MTTTQSQSSAIKGILGEKLGMTQVFDAQNKIVPVTVISAGPCVLHSITFNTTAATAVTVYDNTAASGTKIATFPSSAVVGDYEFGCKFSTGLTIVTAAASDITVIWE